MERKKFLKPFAASIAALLVGAQAHASIDSKLTTTIEKLDAGQASTDGLTLSNATESVQMAAHGSHSSHSSHSSHASHSSHSSSAH
jgi:hypothetical protein